MNTCRWAIEVYEALIEIEKESVVALKEELKKEIDELQEQARELKGRVEEKEKIWTHLKEEMVSRGREIATM